MKKNVGLTRERATELLNLLKQRAVEVNRDPQYIWAVCRLVVFGSYLSNKERLGDLDVAVEVVPKTRNHDKHVKRWNEQSALEGKGSFFKRLIWALIYLTHPLPNLGWSKMESCPGSPSRCRSLNVPIPSDGSTAL